MLEFDRTASTIKPSQPKSPCVQSVRLRLFPSSIEVTIGTIQTKTTNANVTAYGRRSFFTRV
jgi:hypothetical protein